MKIVLALATSLPTLAAACTDDASTTPVAIVGGFTADYDTSADYFTESEGLVPGPSPHGDTQIWYTTNIRSLLGKHDFVVPTGTTAIKEFDMDEDGNVDGIAVMVKKAAGYDSANNDWSYEMRDAQGTLKADPPAGKIEMCIGCHASSRDTDFLSGFGRE
jgi:hypothetical protein